WVGAAHCNTATALNSSSLIITGDGSYNYSLNTTAGFVDPTRSATLLSPSSGADYQCDFAVDSASTYSLKAQLNQNSFVQLSSVASGTIFQKFNLGTLQSNVNQAGILAPGQYEVRVNTSLGIPQPLADGENQLVSSGSFNNFTFTVQAPEPSTISLIAIT